jgi:TnpA family transposase
MSYAFCQLLGFDLLPRIKRIGDKKLYLPSAEQKQDYPNLQPILKSAIDWEVIRYSIRPDD